MIHRKTIRSLTLAAALAAVPTVCTAQSMQKKIMSSDPDDGEFWGAIVGITNEFAVVGEAGESVGGQAAAGNAEVFRRNGVDWVYETTLSANDFSGQDLFGSTVVVDGSYALIAATQEDHASGFGGTVTDGGAVYVFRRSYNFITGQYFWTQIQKVVAPFGGISSSKFGTSIGYDHQNSRMIVGAPFNGNGRAYVYDQAADGTFTFAATLSANDGAANDEFGYSVDIEGNTCVVGAHSEDTGVFVNQGAVYVYERSNANVWSQTSKFMPADRASGDDFGRAVQFTSGMVAVGAPFDDYDGFSGAGSVYMIRKSGGSWIQQDKVLNPNPATVNSFGIHVSANDERMGVAPSDGPVSLYKRNFQLTDALVSFNDPEAETGFPAQIAVGGDFLIIGDNFDDQGGAHVDGGAAYIYTTQKNGSNSCSTATYVEEGVFFGTTRGATDDGDSTCGAGNSPDVWYEFHSQCSGPVRISTLGSNFDTVVNIRSNNCNAAITHCNDDIAPPLRHSEIIVDTTEYGNVLIRIAGFNGTVGDFVLTIQNVRPANDQCVNATTIAGSSASYSNCMATTDGPNPAGACRILDDVWFRWTAPCTGTANIHTCGSSNDYFDPVIAAYAGDCPAANASPLACNSGGGTACEFFDSDDQAAISFSVVAGQVYTIRAGTLDNGTVIDHGHRELIIECNACPCDWNHADGLDSQDYFDFLDGFFNGDADFNGVDGTDSQDYFEFLECFFAGCPS